MSFENLIFFQCFVTFMMTGVIWQVQIVTYPLFVDLRGFDDGGDAVKALHRFYTPKITLVVLPLMFGELVLASIMLLKYPSLSSTLLFIPVLLCWLVTFFISVPLHSSMEESANKRTAILLVKSNWLRTIFWSIRSIGLLSVLIQ